MEPLGMSLSWGGDQVVLWNEDEFRFGPVDALSSNPFTIPLMNTHLDPKAGELNTPGQLLWWLSEHQRLLYQFEREADSKPLCSFFDTRTRGWRSVASCPWGEYLDVTHIKSGPGEGIAISSSAEGHDATTRQI